MNSSVDLSITVSRSIIADLLEVTAIAPRLVHRYLWTCRSFHNLSVDDEPLHGTEGVGGGLADPEHPGRIGRPLLGLDHVPIVVTSEGADLEVRRPTGQHGVLGVQDEVPVEPTAQTDLLLDGLVATQDRGLERLEDDVAVGAGDDREARQLHVGLVLHGAAGERVERDPLVVERTARYPRVIDDRCGAIEAHVAPEGLEQAPLTFLEPCEVWSDAHGGWGAWAFGRAPRWGKPCQPCGESAHTDPPPA